MYTNVIRKMYKNQYFFRSFSEGENFGNNQFNMKHYITRNQKQIQIKVFFFLFSYVTNKWDCAKQCPTLTSYFRYLMYMKFENPLLSI